MRIIISIILAILLGLAQAQESRLMRFPTINNDKIVFSYAGDLYSVTRSGGMANKLTSDIGYEMFSHFSPDGKNIAFTASYDGNNEVYTIPADGGIPKRLTYTTSVLREGVGYRMGPNNITMTWTPDGKQIVFRSRMNTFNDFLGKLYKVNIDGGIPEELPFPVGGFCSYSPDGKQLAYNRVFREFRTWKYYKGGMADDIWIYDFTTKQSINITSNDAQDIEPMWYGTEIYFLSDRDRTMNLFVYDTQTKLIKKVTTFTDYDIKFPSLGGGAIVFEQAGYLWVFDIKSQKLQKISITLQNDFVYSRSAIKDVSKNLNTFDISPDGKRLVFGARGDVFTVPVKEGITRNLTHSSNSHDRVVNWSPDGKFIAYFSDKTGEFEIYIQASDGSAEPIQITKDAETYKYDIRWSPDSKKIIWDDKMNQLHFVDITTKQVTLIEASAIGEFTGAEWSPDSKWITYTLPIANSFQKIMLYNIDTKQKNEVTNGWYDASSPTFSSDGKYLAFVSRRDFNPTYSDVEWNISYSNMSKIYLVLLSKKTINPFASQNDEVAITIAPIDDKKESAKSETKSLNLFVIDVDGIQDRVVTVPTVPADYGNITLVNNKVFYNVFSENGAALKVFDITTKKEADINENASYKISADGTKMGLTQTGKYMVVDVPAAKVNFTDLIDLSNMKVQVDVKQEWKQIFDESWRQMRDFFYDKNMNGVNWKAMHDKYAVFLPYVNHREDLNYIIGEMIGELNCGHAYVNGGDVPHNEKSTIGQLGAQVVKHSSGYYQITTIMNGANWNADLRSPLTMPGISVKIGDYIIAINGRSVKDVDNMFALLVNTVGKSVEITTNTSPSELSTHKSIIVPIQTEQQLVYYNWVQNNLRKVEQASGGQIGYIHVPNMMTEGLNEFVKYFYPQLDKKALIIDDRYNGGGNVSPMIVERLHREITRISVSRNQIIPSVVPRQAFIGPKALLINNYSASDGDLFPYAFRKHSLGKIIGMRSWGGVIGIRGSLTFIDGGELRKPEFATYAADTSQWIIEGRGVEPDITVDNDPSHEYNGVDDQLNKAIDLILEELKTLKPLPPVPPSPDKSK